MNHLRVSFSLNFPSQLPCCYWNLNNVTSLQVLRILIPFWKKSPRYSVYDWTLWWYVLARFLNASLFSEQCSANKTLSPITTHSQQERENLFSVDFLERNCRHGMWKYRRTHMLPICHKDKYTPFGSPLSILPPPTEPSPQSNMQTQTDWRDNRGKENGISFFNDFILPSILIWFIGGGRSHGHSRSNNEIRIYFEWDSAHDKYRLHLCFLTGQ